MQQYVPYIEEPLSPRVSRLRLLLFWKWVSSEDWMIYKRKAYRHKEKYKQHLVRVSFPSPGLRWLYVTFAFAVKAYRRIWRTLRRALWLSQLPPLSKLLLQVFDFLRKKFSVIFPTMPFLLSLPLLFITFTERMAEEKVSGKLFLSQQDGEVTSFSSWVLLPFPPSKFGGTASWAARRLFVIVFRLFMPPQRVKGV